MNDTNIKLSKSQERKYSKTMDLIGQAFPLAGTELTTKVMGKIMDITPIYHSRKGRLTLSFRYVVKFDMCDVETTTFKPFWAVK